LESALLAKAHGTVGEQEFWLILDDIAPRAG
jgi:hypothetical protein